MTTEIILFVLRLLSGLLLLAILAVVFFAIWRDNRSAMSASIWQRRIYGQLTQLTEVDGSYLMTGTAYPLMRLTSLGRAPTNSVIVDDSFASSDHALVALRSGQWWLEDRHSRNGTTLNEIRISQPVVITDGDIIGIGQIRFRLDLEQ
jgi:hypothetical protein